MNFVDVSVATNNELYRALPLAKPAKNTHRRAEAVPVFRQ